MNHYPVMLKLDDKRVVVVGGGKVAERKVAGLAGTGAKITVVSPEVTEYLSQLAVKGAITWQQRVFTACDLEEAFIIFAATNNQELNQSIKKAAGSHQLVTIGDDPDGSDFHVPASFQRGLLTIAVSTGGASPIFARQIRMQLEEQFGEDYQEYLQFLFDKREFILREISDPLIKKQLLAKIAQPEFLTSETREQDFQRIYKEITKAGS